MPGNMNEEKTQSTHSVVPARKGFWGLIWKVKTRTECGSVANLIQVKSGLLQYQLHSLHAIFCQSNLPLNSAYPLGFYLHTLECMHTGNQTTQTIV